MKTGYWLALGVGVALIGGGGSVVVYNATRGYRNNNPGNLRDQGISWKGLKGHDSKGFCIFDTPENGLRAMAINAAHLQSWHGANTLRKLGDLWAPASDNKGVGGYGVKLARQLGVDPDVDFDIKTRWADVVKAIVRNENTLWLYPQPVLLSAILDAQDEVAAA